MEEIWKTINDFEDYEISNFGRIKSHKEHRGTSERILKPRVVKDGYLMVALYKNKKCYNRQVHRLVAEHFIIKEVNKNEVNHIDRNKHNNCSNNLEWVTHLENIRKYVLLKNRKINV